MSPAILCLTWLQIWENTWRNTLFFDNRCPTQENGQHKTTRIFHYVPLTFATSTHATRHSTSKSRHKSWFLKVFVTSHRAVMADPRQTRYDSDARWFFYVFLVFLLLLLCFGTYGSILEPILVAKLASTSCLSCEI